MNACAAANARAAVRDRYDDDDDDDDDATADDDDEADGCCIDADWPRVRACRV